MNMLTNKVPFGLLSEDEQELFKSVNDGFQWYNNGKWMSTKNPSYAKSTTYRLKLKEGEWYKIEWMNHCFILKCVDVKGGDFIEECFAIPKAVYDWQSSESMLSECEVFRPATQAEIDSVKPQESFVDVEISWFKHHAVISHPFGFAEELHKVIKGHLIGGYVLVDYVIEDGVEQKILSNPIVTTYYDSDIRHIEKATHARFVRLEQ